MQEVNWYIFLILFLFNLLTGNRDAVWEIGWFNAAQTSDSSRQKHNNKHVLLPGFTKQKYNPAASNQC